MSGGVFQVTNCSLNLVNQSEAKFSVGLGAPFVAIKHKVLCSEAKAWADHDNIQERVLNHCNPIAEEVLVDVYLYSMTEEHVTFLEICLFRVFQVERS